MNREEELAALKEYIGSSQWGENISKFFQRVAATGCVGQPWNIVREAVYLRATELGGNNENAPANEFKELVVGFDEPPFTVQRLFELLCGPTISVKSKELFWNSLMLNARVTITVKENVAPVEFSEKPRVKCGKGAELVINEGDPKEDENIAQQSDTMLDTELVESSEEDFRGLYPIQEEEGEMAHHLTGISFRVGEEEEEEGGDENEVSNIAQPSESKTEGDNASDGVLAPVESKNNANDTHEQQEQQKQNTESDQKPEHKSSNSKRSAESGNVHEDSNHSNDTHSPKHAKYSSS
eukprot:m.24849 g.24849  ORF g.24849 m.24849 type:complete len:296 (-) comp9141_c0_seq1:85-972(-)